MIEPDENMNKKQAQSTVSPQGGCRPFEQNTLPAAYDSAACHALEAQIIAAAGREPSECKCAACKAMCRQPCLGTPADIERLIAAGYGARLMKTEWWVGLLLGIIGAPILLIAPIRAENGWCTFRMPDGGCELHTKGLKPLQGRLAHHTGSPTDVAHNITWLVAKTWLPFQHAMWGIGPTNQDEADNEKKIEKILAIAR